MSDHYMQHSACMLYLHQAHRNTCMLGPLSFVHSSLELILFHPSASNMVVVLLCVQDSMLLEGHDSLFTSNSSKSVKETREVGIQATSKCEQLQHAPGLFI